MVKSQIKKIPKISGNRRVLWNLASMDLTKVNFHLHRKWQLIESSPHRLIFKSPHINDTLASIEIEVEGDAICGTIKSSANPIGNRVILGRGMPHELLLMLIVDVLTAEIFDYTED